MRTFGPEGGSRRPLILVGLGVIAAVLAIVLNFLATPPHDEPHLRPPPGAAPPPDQGLPQSAPEEGTLGFDVVRVHPTGDTVMAGRAPPGSAVAILDGDARLGEVLADGRGEWVFLPDTPLAPGSHRLRLEIHTPGEPVLIADDEVLIIVPRPGEDIAGRPGETGQQPLALRLSRSAGVPVGILQRPVSDGTEITLVIDAVDHDADRGTRLFGRGSPGAALRLYANDRLLGETTAAKDGSWQFALKEPLPAGPYSLRVEQGGEGGRVIARDAIPFTAALAPSVGTNQIIVERGQSLWRIARDMYGSGPSYLVIYDANRPQIRDPDRIFPGQVLQLPRSPAGSEPAGRR